MHELSAAKELLDILEKECETKGISNPKKVITRLGTLTTYSKEPIVFYFDQLKKQNDLLKDVVLIVEKENGKIRCKTCKKESFVKHSYLLFCPYCNSDDITVVEGKDFIIRHVESDD
jgi:hydrogenase nickel incorporation protein HypA/HybF